MRIVMSLGASAAVALLAGGCHHAPASEREASDGAMGAEEQAVQSETGPIADTLSIQRQPAAVRFNCEGDLKLDVSFDDDGPSISLNRPGEALRTLPLHEQGEFAVYSDGWSLFRISGSEAYYTEHGKIRACNAAIEDAPPPVVEGVARDFRAADSGSKADFKAGDLISISLVGVPTAGYQWMVEAKPDFLTQVGEAGGATSTAQFLPGFAGGNHWEVLVFQADKSGKGELTLAERRPWEDASEPASDTFSVTIRVE